MLGRKSSCEVLVVGAGPVGLFSALELARRGVAVEIIDSQWRTAERSYALALHARTLEIFDETGMLEALIDKGRKVREIGFYDGVERKATIDLGGLSRQRPYLLVVPQNLLERCLEERLEAAGVRIKWSHRLVGLDVGSDSVEATVHRLSKESTGYSVAATEWVIEKTMKINARFVLGADGHHSAVRRLAGIEAEDHPGSQSFAVFECESDRDPGDAMGVVLEDGRSNVLWPLPGERFRWSFELDHGEGVGERKKQRLAVQVGEKSYQYLSPDSLSDLIAERAPWFGLGVEKVKWSVGVEFRQRAALEFGRGPLSLIGDAAHTAGPIGVKSMNSGLADARALASAVAGLLEESGSRDAVDALNIERASAWRRSRDAWVAGDTATDWVSRRVERLPKCVPAIGADLAQLLGQLGLEPPSS